MVLPVEERNDELKPVLQTRHVVMLSLGGAIGSGLFLGSGSVIATAGPAAILAYVLAGFSLYIVMNGVAKMILFNKKSSDVGMSAIVKPYIGARMAHFTDWVYWSTWMAVLIAEEAGVATFLGMLIPGVPLWIFALIVAVLGTAINLCSVRAFAETEYWLAFIKIAVIIILIAVGLYLLFINNVHLGFKPTAAQLAANNSTASSFAPNGMQGVINSMLVVIFSFGGSELAAVTVAETKDAKTAIPKAIRSVLFRIIAFYVVPIFLFLQLLPWKQVADPNAESPFATLFTRVGIPHADKLILIVIVIAIFSAVNSAIYATSRSLYARVQGSETKLGRGLSKLNRNQVPTRTIWVSSAVLFLGVVLSAIFGDGFWQFVAGSISYTISTVWIVLLVSALILYFKHGGVANIFLKSITVIVLLFLIFVVYSQITSNPWYLSIFALVICLLAFFSYRKPVKS